jgi:hypothetical protein
MRNLRARIDKITREIGMGELWDGDGTAENLCVALWGDEPGHWENASDGTKRMATAISLTMAAAIVVGKIRGEDAEEVQEYRDILGVDADATESEVVDAALGVAH